MADCDFIAIVVETTMVELSHCDPEFASGGPSWLVAAEPTSGVELWLHRAPASHQPGHYLYGSPHHRLLVSAFGDGPAVHLFEAPGPKSGHAIDVFDSEATLSRKEIITLESGSCLLAPAHDIVLEVQPGPAFYLELLSPAAHTVRWTYERDSLRGAELLTGDPEQNRILAALAMLGELEYAEAVPALEQMARHRSHAVRWAAVQAIYALSEQAGQSALESACSDPHPEIAELARSSLRALDADS